MALKGLYQLMIQITDLIHLMLNMNHYQYQNDEIIELNNLLLMEIIHRLNLKDFILVKQFK
jgi:hypothetical protein